jgi:hypothetical protein
MTEPNGTAEPSGASGGYGEREPDLRGPAVPCRVRVGSSRTGWVVAASAYPPWIVAVKMDDTGLTEAHAVENVSDERDPTGHQEGRDG